METASDRRPHGRRGTPLAPWPIVSTSPARLKPDEIDRCERVARDLLRDDPSLARAAAFNGNVSAGWAPAPNLIYEDHRPIELASTMGLSKFEYRALALANTDDFFLLSRARSPHFEAYLENVVGFGVPTIVEVARESDIGALDKACLDDEVALGRLAQAARAAGGLNVVPYMASGYAWLLAGAIAERAGVHVQVSAAAPRLVRRANDKIWFARLIRRVLGRDAVPMTFSAYGSAAAAGRLRRLAASCERVVVKLPASAGSKGNLTLDSARVRQLPLAELRDRLVDALRQLGWRERFPILIGIWEQPTISSPSVQVWIPDQADGAPIIEGVFVQSLEGEAGTFVGAVAADLPHIRDRVCRDAMMLATVLQRLGYFGRLSLDALLVGSDPNAARVQWIECNARWGGVSIPLTLANRIGADPRAVAVVQRAAGDLPASDFTSVLTVIGHRLYRAPGPARGILCLTPCGEEDSGIDLLSCAETSDAAMAQARAVLDDLASVPGPGAAGIRGDTQT